MMRSLLLVSMCWLTIQNANAVRVTVRVVDEIGNSISNAQVSVGFMANDLRGPGTHFKNHDGTTDESGIYKVSDRSDGPVALDVRKEGYYTSTTGYVDTYGKDKSGSLGWIDPEVTITLRKVGNPAPMYASNISSIPLPDGEKDFAYDLIVRDWVSPHGKGTVPDVIFNARRIYDDSGKLTGETLRVSFPNNGDGVIPIPETQVWKQSRFKLPREAPIKGYTNAIFRWENWGEERGYLNNDRKDLGYFLRIRTVKETNDQVITALYGKIAGDFEVWTRHEGVPTISLRYYINPEPNSRNLEFDPRHDLFKDGGVGDP